MREKVALYCKTIALYFALWEKNIYIWEKKTVTTATRKKFKMVIGMRVLASLEKVSLFFGDVVLKSQNEIHVTSSVLLLSQLSFLLVWFDLQMLWWALKSDYSALVLSPIVAQSRRLQAAWSGLQWNSMCFHPFITLLCAPHQGENPHDGNHSGTFSHCP